MRQHVDDRVLDAGADLVREILHEPLVLPRARAEAVGRHRRQEPELELGREIGRAEQAELREQRRDREVEEAGEALQDA